ncbi:MAG: hypothetical protein RIA69_00725 [Cyclobacteriaceae bacterium]
MEKNQGYIDFLEVWHQGAFYAFIASLGVALIIFITYRIRYALTSGMKEKYELASEFEIKNYLRANYAVGIGIFFIANTNSPDVVELSPAWFFIRMFIAICAGTLHGYIMFLIFRYYYPGPLEKKLKKLRYSPRINSRTGNAMKLLSEDEEDAYLDEGMQAEEDAFSVDYDVWIDEETGETQIEKYKGHLAAFECDRCGFQTLKLQKEEVITEPNDFQDGELLKEFKCGYCGRVKRKTVSLTKNVEKNASAMATINSTKLDVVKVDVIDDDGVHKVYEFQNKVQAEKFLKELEIKKREN